MMPSRETLDRVCATLVFVVGIALIFLIAALVLGCESRQIQDHDLVLTDPIDSVFVTDEPEPQPPTWVEGPGIFLGRHVTRYQNASVYTDFYLVTQQSIALQKPKENADLAGGDG